MALETYELDKKMLEYSISQFRNIPEYVKMCEAFAVGLGTIQTAVDYLSDMIDLEKAEGIWLDYIAWLVGTNRSAYNILNFFCINAPHINVEKEFYFEGITPDAKGSLQDVLLRKRIRAKIAYNTSKATRNENIRIIRDVLNADKVVISKPKIFDNFTTVGTPTITADGIASGFSTSNYLTVPNALNYFVNAVTDFDFYIPFTLNNYPVARELIVRGQYNSSSRFLIAIDANKTTKFNFSSFGSETIVIPATNLELNVDYIIKLSLHQGTLKYGYYKNNIYTETGSMQISSIDAMNWLRIGSGNNNSGFTNGSIDLKQFSITVDGKVVYRPYREAPMMLDITLYGDKIIYPAIGSVRDTINDMLGNGVGLRNLEIKGASEI